MSLLTSTAFIFVVELAYFQAYLI